MAERDPMQHPESRRVRDLVYETLAGEGRAPSVRELAVRTGSEPARV